MYDNDPNFEIVGSLTSKMNLFDGFKRQYSVGSKVEEIAGLWRKIAFIKNTKKKNIDIKLNMIILYGKQKMK